jgi:hypothetical protein
MMELALRRFTFENGSSIVVNNIFKMYDCLLNAYQSLRTVANKRSSTDNIYHINNKIKILTILFMEFEKFQINLNKSEIDNIEVTII